MKCFVVCEEIWNRAMQLLVDYGWEVFKGISPTVIALLSIWITTKISKEQKEKEEYLSEVKEIQIMVSELMIYVLNAGKDLLDAIQNSKDTQKYETLLDSYFHNSNKMLAEARKICSYVEIRAEINNCDRMKFNNVLNAVSQYAHGLIEILQCYDERAAQTVASDFEKLCDDVQKELIGATDMVEAAIFDYCVELKEK